MSCSRARRELLGYFALGEELGPGSGPLLTHVESCAQCRRDLGIDRELINNLRRALQERVEGNASSEASWGLVRRRTVERPVPPWTVRVAHWKGMVSAAAAAGMMLFAVATAPDTTVLPVTQPTVASAARRVVPPLEDARPPEVFSSTYLAPQKYPPPGWPMQTQFPDEDASREGDPPIPGIMQVTVWLSS